MKVFSNASAALGVLFSVLDAAASGCSMPATLGVLMFSLLGFIGALLEPRRVIITAVTKVLS